MLHLHHHRCDSSLRSSDSWPCLQFISISIYKCIGLKKDNTYFWWKNANVIRKYNTAKCQLQSYMVIVLIINLYIANRSSKTKWHFGKKCRSFHMNVSPHHSSMLPYNVEDRQLLWLSACLVEAFSVKAQDVEK